MADRPRVLVVEDEGLIAVDLVSILAELGCDCVGPVFGLAEAIRQAKTAEIDAAILNLILDGQPAYAVAEILAARGIPFGFASGVLLITVEPRWADRPFLRKPYSAKEVLQLVESVLGRALRPPEP